MSLAEVLKKARVNFVCKKQSGKERKQRKSTKGYYKHLFQPNRVGREDETENVEEENDT